jgi:hypothetical protein
MTRLLSLVAVMGASACVGSSGFLAYTNMSNKLKRGREEREEEDKIRERLGKEESKAKYSKEANESAQGERDEAERKKKEAERIEKEKAKWTTFLNNFVILQYIKGDQEAIQKIIPVPLNRQNLKKPRNFKPGYGQHRLPFKYRDGYNPAQEIQARLNKKDLEYISTVFDNFIESGIPIQDNISNLKQKTAAEVRILTDLGYPVIGKPVTKDNGKPTELESALKITQCYEEKTKGMPDYYSLSQADRVKRLRLLLEDCGGSKNVYFSWLTAAANESAQGERDEAERIEKESSKWATMLNNFRVAQTFRGDVAGPVKRGLMGVPGELIPRVVDKLKKRNTKKWQFCPEFSDNMHIDAFGFNRVVMDLGGDISKEMWKLYFTGDLGTASAFEITKCYEDKTKGLPDFYSLNNGCDRSKRFKIMEECGGHFESVVACECKSSQ